MSWNDWNLPLRDVKTKLSCSESSTCRKTLKLNLLISHYVHFHLYGIYTVYFTFAFAVVIKLTVDFLLHSVQSCRIRICPVCKMRFPVCCFYYHPVAPFSATCVFVEKVVKTATIFRKPVATSQASLDAQKCCPSFLELCDSALIWGRCLFNLSLAKEDL